MLQCQRMKFQKGIDIEFFHLLETDTVLEITMWEINFSFPGKIEK